MACAVAVKILVLMLPVAELSRGLKREISAKELEQGYAQRKS